MKIDIWFAILISSLWSMFNNGALAMLWVTIAGFFFCIDLWKQHKRDQARKEMVKAGEELVKHLGEMAEKMKQEEESKKTVIKVKHKK